MDHFCPPRPDRSEVQTCSFDFNIYNFDGTDSVLRNNSMGQVKLRIRIIYLVKNRLLRTDARAVRPPPFRIYAILEHTSIRNY